MAKTKPLKSMSQTLAIRLAQMGDQGAIDVLVKQHMGYIKHAARRYGKQRDDAIQLGVVGFMEALNRFDTSRDVRLVTYTLYNVRKFMENLIRDTTKELQFDAVRELHDSSVDGLEDPVEDKLPAPAPPKFAEELRDAINALSDIEKQIIQLRYFEGLTMRETSEIIRLCFQRVHQLEHRALAKMKDYLK